jgi:UDP-2,3-diacylglucosamine pyrophosphatase LpxH
VDTAPIFKGLDKALNSQFFSYHTEIDLGLHVPWVIVSDQHKGAGDPADEFRLNKATYLDALRHYNADGYKLVLLGDVEELWENSMREVVAAHHDVFEAEAAFGADRYLRVWGNHDDRWMEEVLVAVELMKYAPGRTLRRAWESIRVTVRDGDEQLGTVFLTHGHQGTAGSDKFRVVSRVALRFYRWLQNRFNIGWFEGVAVPSRDKCLRGEHDRAMYEWALTKERMILVVGHTHRPVWAGRTHLQELQSLEQKFDGSPAMQSVIDAVEQKIRQVTEEFGSCHDVPASLPAYFNTGCCKFNDGDITGIEIRDGSLLLVKWERPTDGQPARRKELQRAPLRDLLTALAAGKAAARG